MRLRKLSITAIGCVLASTGILASPAYAALVGLITYSNSGATPTALAGVAGDTFRLENDLPSGSIVLVNASGSFNFVSSSCAIASGSCALTSGSTKTFTVAGEGSGRIYAWTGTAAGALLATIYINASGTDTGGDTTESASSSAPGPVMQEFGVPASGNCDAAAPITLNWAGVDGGGWSKSWAQWMNGGSGGAVCTRTLVYSTAQSKWIVG
jgi:hypothetical protein